jgi:hypothetical protein
MVMYGDQTMKNKIIQKAEQTEKVSRLYVALSVSYKAYVNKLEQ